MKKVLFPTLMAVLVLSACTAQGDVTADDTSSSAALEDAMMDDSSSSVDAMMDDSSSSDEAMTDDSSSSVEMDDASSSAEDVM